MSPTILTVLSFTAVVAALLGIYSLVADLFLRDRSRLGRRLDDEFRKQQRERARKSTTLFKDLEAVASPAADGAKPNLRRRFELLVEQSGLKLTPRRLLIIMASSGLTLGALVGLLRQSLLIGLAAGLAAAAIPLLYVWRKRRLQLEALLSQLPDAFDLMARALRAGQTIAQSLQAVADEFPPPLAAEFAYCYEQQNLGLPPELALRDLADRTGLLEIKILVLSILVQQQTGGNLAEILDKLAWIVRERFRVRGKIRALTAEGRFQAIILLLLPIAVFFMLLLLNRTYAQELLNHPGLLLGIVVFEGLGALWIRQIVNFDF